MTANEEASVTPEFKLPLTCVIPFTDMEKSLAFYRDIGDCAWPATSLLASASEAYFSNVFPIPEVTRCRVTAMQCTLEPGARTSISVSCNLEV